MADPKGVVWAFVAPRKTGHAILHAQAFHARAAEVAGQINRGQFDEAQRALRSGTPFGQALADLGLAFRRMKAAADTIAA